MVAVRGVVRLFTATNELMSPTPEAGSPIEELLFVQLNTVPAAGSPEKLTVVVCVPVQSAWFAGLYTITFADINVPLTVLVKTSPPELMPDNGKYKEFDIFCAQLTTKEPPPPPAP